MSTAPPACTHPGCGHQAKTLGAWLAHLQQTGHRVLQKKGNGR